MAGQRGEAQPITGSDTADQTPIWSPDGASIAYVGSSLRTNEIFVIEAEGGGEPRRLTNGANAQRVDWDAAGQALLVSGSWGSDRYTIRRVPIAGGEPVPLEPAIDFGRRPFLADFDVSHDGTFLAFTLEEVRGDIWLLEAVAGRF